MQSGQRSEAHPTFHQARVAPAAGSLVRAMDVPQTVVSQLRRVAQTLKDGVHEALEEEHTRRRAQELRSGQRKPVGSRGDSTEGTHAYRVAQVLQTHQTVRTLAL